MTTPKTVQEWFEQKDLPVELARVLRKAEHEWLEPAVYYGPSDPLGYVVKCQKCGHVKTIQEDIDGCPVPDPITIDWNSAKYWQNKCDDNDFFYYLREVYRNVLSDHTTKDVLLVGWLIYDVQPKHWLVAAAMAVERSKE